MLTLINYICCEVTQDNKHKGFYTTYGKQHKLFNLNKVRANLFKTNIQLINEV